MVDVFETIDVPLAIVYKDRWRTPSMSLRRKTVPPTQKHPRSSSSGRKELIAKEKTEKQSVRKRTVLDNRFHRTRACGRRPSRIRTNLSRIVRKCLTA